MSHLKLMKLLYLADREAMGQWGAPISWDHLTAMPQGPVLSTTLDLMNGGVESSSAGWEYWVSDKENHEVSLRVAPPNREELDELSDAELETLKGIWERFGMMNRWELRDYTHQHCPEWKDPQGSSFPLNYGEVLRALGWDADKAQELSEQIEDEHQIDRLLSI